MSSSPPQPPPRRPHLLRGRRWRRGLPGGRSPLCSSTWTACSATARSPRGRLASTSSRRWASRSPWMISSPSWALVSVDYLRSPTINGCPPIAPVHCFLPYWDYPRLATVASYARVPYISVLCVCCLTGMLLHSTVVILP